MRDKFFAEPLVDDDVDLAIPPPVELPPGTAVVTVGAGKGGMPWLILGNVELAAG